MNPVEMGADVFAARVQRLLYQLIRDYERCDQMCVAQYGVTASQSYALLALPERFSMAMNELSEAMGLASSTMTRTVDQLVLKGLVHRQHDDEDRRVVRVGLTARGKQVRCDLEKALQEFFKQALDEIREDERPVIVDALEKVTELMGKGVRACCNG